MAGSSEKTIQPTGSARQGIDASPPDIPGQGRASRGEILAWAFFDFANSGYTTVVLTTIYSAYFVAVVAGGLDEQHPGSATLVWTLSLGLANFAVLLVGPVLGAIADRRAAKKRFLVISTLSCAACTAGLAFTGADALALAVCLLVLSAMAFAIGENLIAAFLPEISDKETMGRISGYGWSLGYFGGLLVLGICLAYIQWAQGAGQTAEDYVPATLILTAVVFLLAAMPTFLKLKERAVPLRAQPGVSYFSAARRQVGQTLRHTGELPDLFRFLCCLTLYQAGVATVIVVAAIYAQEVMGFTSSQLIVLIMVVNLTAAAGAFLFGYLQDHWGSVSSLTAALMVWVIAILITFDASEAWQVWLAGNLIGLAMGATQAGGRALIGRLTPADRNAEIFGLWGLSTRAAAIIGPVSYGVVTGLSEGNYQLALLVTLGFFLAGMALLRTVDEARGIAAAARQGRAAQ